MLTEQEIKQIQEEATDKDVIKLISEIDRLKCFIRDYGNSVSAKLVGIEEELVRLEAENARLVSVKRAAYIERDACISLLCQLAVGQGLRVGTAPENQVILDLPSGQVSWGYNASEAHLFSSFSAYPDAPGSIEDLSIEEKYHRVMNPGVMNPSVMNPEV